MIGISRFVTSNNNISRVYYQYLYPEGKDIIKVDLPGIDPAEVSLAVEPGDSVSKPMLHLKVKQEQWSLPISLKHPDLKAISATLTHGQLTITVPEREKTVATIPIQIN